MRAERLALVGAEMSVRIEPGGKVTVFAGSDKRPIATASVTPPPETEPAREPEPAIAPVEDAAPKSGIENLAALLAWIDSLGATGLDGHDLAELGLKSGNLIVDDQRNGKRWNFENIDLSLMRAKSGNVVFKVGSASEDQPWSLSAAVAPLRSGRRVFMVEARRVLAKDLLLALRLGDDPIMAQVPLSASLRAEIGADGTTQILAGPRYRRSRLPDGVHRAVGACHRPRRIQSGMGCRAPRPGGAFPDRCRRQPLHALRACRAAAHAVTGHGMSR